MASLNRYHNDQLLDGINFKYIIFNKKKFELYTIKEAINHLTDYLLKNMHSDSPFIVLLSANHIKTIIAYYAVLKAGKIAVILDPGAKSIDMDEINQDLHPAAVILTDKNTIFFNYSQEIVFRDQSKDSFNADLKDVCTLVYTNAEDGFSKGAMITERNLLTQIEMYTKATNINEQTVNCALLPFSHLYGLVNGIIIPSQSKGKSLITEIDLFKIEKIIKELYDCKVNHLYSVPSVYYLLGKVPEIKNLTKHLKFLVSGASPLNTTIFENFYLKTTHKIREGYGLTECSPAVSLDYDMEPIKGSVGKPMPGCLVKIVDNNNNECETGQVGEILVQGENIFKGYFNHENITKTVLKEGWFHTGDYGKKDSSGYLFFCGVKKDMINIGGNKIYPKKLQRQLSMHKNVLSVEVIGEPSILLGQTVEAKIKLKNNSKQMQEEVKSWCFKNINNTFLPKTWNFE